MDSLCFFISSKTFRSASMSLVEAEWLAISNSETCTRHRKNEPHVDALVHDATQPGHVQDNFWVKRLLEAGYRHGI